jgi:hypothetical protein
MPQYPRPAYTAARHREDRVERLIDRLPDTLRRTIRWLGRPSSCWVRIPAGLLLIAGSLLSVLPFFAVWMLPLGLMLLAEDVPPLRRARDRLIDRIERHRPNWFTTNERTSTPQASTNERTSTPQASPPSSPAGRGFAQE